MTAKPILLNWIANDDLRKVLQGLFFLANKYKDEELYSSATFQSGRLKALEEQLIKNIIATEDERIEAAKIRHGLLQISQRIPNDWLLDGIENESEIIPLSSKRNWKKYAVSVVVVVALLAGIADILGYKKRIFLKEKKLLKNPPKSNRSFQKQAQQEIIVLPSFQITATLTSNTVKPSTKKIQILKPEIYKNEACNYLHFCYSEFQLPFGAGFNDFR